MKFRILLALLCLSRATAAPITIPDFSFEDGDPAGPGFSYTITPWVRSNNNAGAFKEQITGFASHGTDHLGLELMAEGQQANRNIYQSITGVTYQANTTYTLTVAVGHRSGNTTSGNISRYRLASSTTVFATGEYNAFTNVPAGTFADAPPLVFNTANNAAAVGQTIRIRLEARGAGRSHFDNIRLDATPNTPVGTPTVTNSAASSITQNSATLNGTITSIGSAAPTVTIFYGPTNGGTTAGNWANSVNLTGTFSGAFSQSISGLSPNSSYFFTARATNASGTSWAATSQSFDTAAALATISQSAATAITINSASLPISVDSTGGNAPTVTIFYGTSDGGIDAAVWSNSLALGTQTGAATGNATVLTANTTYYFRARAVNSAGSSWSAASSSFSTLAITPPAISNSAPLAVSGTNALLAGQVTATGNQAPTVTLYYGLTDGGTTAGAWSNNIVLGPKSAGFTQQISGLSPTTAYFFRFFASNSAGSAWAAASDTFTTTNYVPPAPVINEIHFGPADDPTTGPTQHEFIEIFNPGDDPVDLSGWTLTEGITYAFPAGTILNAGAYICVAQNPTAFQARFGFLPLGPYVGKLSNEGDHIVLSNAANVMQDEVEYQSGFPWPTTARGLGPSMELIHPSLDNNLGGSWRSGGTFASAEVVYLNEASNTWKYFRGTEEASDPVSDWRQLVFDDADWTTATTPVGYGGGYVVNTALTGMQSVHSTMYYRNTFTIAAGQVPESLSLRIKYDDGAIVWINGEEVARLNVPAGEVPFNGLASSDHPVGDWETITLNNADSYLNGGTNVICVQSINLTTPSGDYFFDAKINNYTNSSTAVTPGAQNSIYQTLSTAPPVIRQVTHTPNAPAANVPVLITAKITDSDGMGAVSLAYQTVDPGAYIRKTDAAYSTSWTTVGMVDDGTNGDLLAGDGIYSVILPATVQVHRRLVRYTITALDALSNTVKVPYADDEQPNFAYFVYNGVPAYTGKFRPTTYAGFPATTDVTFDSAMIGSLPPYHLVANGTDVENCQYNGSFNGVRFFGTLVYDGVVYDHIQFKNRGIGSTYNTGKNKWNIFFNKARDLQARDNYGNKYKETWNNLILNANACPWASANRGSAGIEEAASARMYELAGNTNFRTHNVHWRVIDSATEQSPTNQYDSDLWGLYLGLEPTESNMLNERGLPDGNIYAIEGNGGDQKHRSEGQPGDGSDWNTFRTAMFNGGQTVQWYRDNMDLDKLYTFLALNRLNGNVDVRPGDNYRYYHRSSDNRWEILAYDLDMQFIAAHHWGGTIDGVFVSGQPNSIVPILRHPELALEYRNRCRELLDLMASDGSANGGQIGQLMDEYARLVDPAGANGNSWAYLDAVHWNMHTRTSGNGANNGQNNSRGNFLRTDFLDGSRGAGGSVSTGSWVRTLVNTGGVNLGGTGFSDFQARVNWYVNFATNTYPTGAAPWVRKATNTAGGGTDSDVNRQKGYGYKYLEWESFYGGYADSRNEPTQAADTNFPNKPTITYTGSTNFPANDVRFTSGGFSDPNGNGTFAAMQWRIGEIYAPGIAGYVAGTPRKYEIETVWHSGDLTSFSPEAQIPVAELRPGTTYRARVRHKDATGRYSNWSEPVQFTVTAPDVTVWQNNLMITEIMYNPAAPTPTELAAGGSNFNNDYEFIELRNISSTLTLDLTELRFTKGVDFDFAGSAITSLAPGAYVLIVKHLPSFQARYGTGLPVAGVWDPLDNLSNSGEQIKLSYGAGTAIHDINPLGARYDQAPWPTAADGAGPSLTLISPNSIPDHNVATNWRAAFVNNGSPGTVDNLVAVNLSGLNHTYDGTEKSASFSTVPAGKAVSLSYNGSPTPPTDGGSYTVSATVTEPGFEGTASATLVIAAATQTIDFTAPASYPLDGAGLSLSATASSGLPVNLALISGVATFETNQLIPLVVGPVTVRATQAGNGNFLAAEPVDVVINITHTYLASSWRNQYFNATQLADTSVSGHSADPDGDGLNNLLEYALNLDPLTAGPSPVVATRVSEGANEYLALSFRRRLKEADIDYAPQISDSLESWNEESGTPYLIEFGTAINNNDGTETVQYRSSIPYGTSEKEFIRLKVSAP